MFVCCMPSPYESVLRSQAILTRQLPLLPPQHRLQPRLQHLLRLPLPKNESKKVEIKTEYTHAQAHKHTHTQTDTFMFMHKHHTHTQAHTTLTNLQPSQPSSLTKTERHRATRPPPRSRMCTAYIILPVACFFLFFISHSIIFTRHQVV